MDERTIETLECVAKGSRHLARKEPRFRHALKLTGPLPLRRREDGFKALLGAIVSQQLSVSAADTIWGRMKSAGLIQRTKILAADEDDMRACGLSRPKIRYAKGLAAAKINYGSLRKIPTDEVVETLIQLKGIGRWTAEIYAMFSLGRADVFAPGDLALQESAKILFGLDERPSEQELREMAERWSPWRAVAARLLWAYYRVEKNREGISNV